MNINLYIDGFNLYYCAVQGTRYKWLNLLVLSNTLFPNDTIHKIKYFSARVESLPHDLNVPIRQDMYWRALKTISQLEIIEGNFVSRPKLMAQYPLAYVNNDISKPPQKVQIQKREEKKSDVNLASYLVYDNCMKDADKSVVISNDSDLTLAIELVTGGLNRPVVVVNPNRTSRLHANPKGCRMHKELKRVATQPIYSINDSILAGSQFPQTMTDAQGSFSKPPTW